MPRRGLAGLIGVAAAGVLGVVLAFGNFNINAQELELGTGKRKAVKVDYTRVKFPHKEHQERLLAKFNGDKEKACTFCHHTKKPGQDPRACRRCHAGRLRKSKGGEGRPEWLQKRTRPGKLMKLKDVFHAQCKGCHEDERERNLDLQANPDKAPVENCAGCHVAPGATSEGGEEGGAAKGGAKKGAKGGAED